MCVSPYIATGKDGKYYPVPCGKCFECLQEYKNDWVFRIKQECKNLPCPIHVTLTYDPQFLPVAYNEDAMEWQSYVEKREVQLFLKRLRKACPEFKKSLRYFAVGEYGGDYNRAHYHVLLMSPKILHKYQYYKKLLAAWGKGFIKITTPKDDDFKFEYLTGYLHKFDDSSHITKPFRLFSKSIGLNYLTDKMVDWYLTQFPTGAHDHDGWKHLPRYYKKKLDEYSHRKESLKICDMCYSDVIRNMEHKPKGIQFIFMEFCNNFEFHYADMYRQELHKARVNNYALPENISVQKAFSLFCAKFLEVIDARRISDDRIRNIKVKHKYTRLTKNDLLKIVSPP